MKPKINILHLDEFPEFSIVTPLKTGDSVSKSTEESVFKNETPFNWISVESENNVMKNFELGFFELLKRKQLAPYIIKIDNDTEWSDGTLDELYTALNKSSESIGYSYCGFQFKGHLNSAFQAIPFNRDKLKQGNYISSNSMFKSKVIYDVGLVTDDKYVRLLDWAFLLKCLNAGYTGIPCTGFFIAHSSQNSISSRSKEDYEIKKNRVLKDFLKN